MFLYGMATDGIQTNNTGGIASAPSRVQRTLPVQLAALVRTGQAVADDFLETANVKNRLQGKSTYDPITASAVNSGIAFNNSKQLNANDQSKFSNLVSDKFKGKDVNIGSNSVGDLVASIKDKVEAPRADTTTLTSMMPGTSKNSTGESANSVAWGAAGATQASQAKVS